MNLYIYLGLTLISLGFYFVNFLYKWFKTARIINKIPGPDTNPLLGNVLQLRKKPHELFSDVLGRVEQFRESKIMRIWLGFTPVVVLYHPEAIEPILTSSTLITKSKEYDLLFDWLRTGLLTSTGDKWRNRRKLLTPAFHFQILNDFIPVFCEQCEILVQKLREKINQEAFDIYHYITLCTLDIICETSMGVKIQAQQRSNSEYVQAIYKVSEIFAYRARTPWLWPYWTFCLFDRGYYENLNIIHNFTKSVIEKKIEEFKIRKSENFDDSDNCSQKHRLAFLDLLLKLSEEGKILSTEDIQEEVDTIMFEGHDTTAVTALWAVYLIGSHPHVQEKLNKELRTIFGTSNRAPTIDDLKEMKYLECTIKETMRLFTTVPYLGRKLTEDCEILGYKLPKNINIIINVYGMHRDPKIFPDPEIFDPDRFLPENYIDRHHFAYIPFSGGPRNCIGQKFALYEEKILLSYLLRNFTLKSLQQRHEILPVGFIVLRSHNSVKIQLLDRD